MLNMDSCPCKRYSKHATEQIIRIFRKNIYKKYFRFDYGVKKIYKSDIIKNIFILSSF